MKKPNITPGPWEARGSFNDIVATTPDLTIACVNRGNPALDSLANAQAIAAVPDLLEALEPFAAYFSEVPTSGGNGTRVSPSFTVQQRQAARAALTKAGYTF